MARKNLVIHPRTGDHLLICIACLVIAIAGAVALLLGLIPNEFRVGAILLVGLASLVGVAFAAMVIVPSRIILREKHLVIKSITGKVRAQIPYANIAQVRLHFVGEDDQQVQAVGVDIVKKNRDTWWPGSYRGRTYDMEIHDDWTKPPNVLVRLIQERMNRFFENVGRGQ